MCVLCERYAEGGNLWFDNPKLYSRQLYSRKEPREDAAGGQKSLGVQGRNVDLSAYLGTVLEEKFEHPERWPELYQQALEFMKGRGYGGQVITLEEAERIVELSSPLGIMACVCRKQSRGLQETNEKEYSCLGTGIGMFKWTRWPERYKGGVKFVSIDDAKKWLRKWNKKGMVQTIMGAPYIVGICNCDYPDCLPIRYRLDYGFYPRLLKGHKVARVKYDECDGCTRCVGRCQFGALKFEATTRHSNVDMYRCFGCGLCEKTCPVGAIELIDRESLPAVQNLW